jgi:hypothetical protein
MEGRSLSKGRELVERARRDLGRKEEKEEKEGRWPTPQTGLPDR